MGYFIKASLHATARAFRVPPRPATGSGKRFSTASRFPGLKRSPNLKTIAPADIAALQSICPSYLTADIDQYNTDWTHRYRGTSSIVLRPKSVKEVSSILSYCNVNRIPVVPQGGNTGLVGGGVPVFDEVVLNLSGMNRIRSFDAISGALVCDAGCLLESLENYADQKGHVIPLDLGAKGTCQIGGNVATNAGGLRLLRYGSLHGTVLGLEVVLADGTVLENLSTLRKDNTGYDLKQLFIGSEGTLGVITGVSLLTPPKSNAINAALLTVEDYATVQKVFRIVKAELGEILSAFEFWDHEAAKLVDKYIEVQFPLEKPGPFQVLIETSGSKKEHDDEKLEGVLTKLMDEAIVQDGTVAQDRTQLASLWRMREDIPLACNSAGAVYKYDLSVPVPALYELVTLMRERFRKAGMYPDGLVSHVIGYGHLGDGNLHLNITAREFNNEVHQLIEPFVYEWTASHGGSISAEHGLGLMKAKHIGYSKSKPMVDMMQKIKRLFDPHGILNPYKVLPPCTDA